MEKFAVDLDKVLDELEFDEGNYKLKKEKSFVSGVCYPHECNLS